MNSTYVIESNPGHIRVFRYKVVRFYTIFMMQLYAFISFPTGYDIINSIRRNFALHEALNIQKQIVGKNIIKLLYCLVLQYIVTIYLLYILIICDITRALNTIYGFNISILLAFKVMKHAWLLDISFTFFWAVLACNFPIIAVLMLL